jgi:very-short-patch-repair endonuclease
LGSQKTMPLSIQDLLDRSRKELLDLSARNRLLSIPVHSKSARLVQVYDELSAEVFRLLVNEKKALSFLPGKQTKPADGPEPPLFDDEEIGLPQPDEGEESGTGIARRYVDLRLQTALSPEGLQRRLLDLFTNARTMIEEQGVNVLYLALGHIKWFEAGHADTPRYAPLILIPVDLQRKTASERFRLKWREEDIEPNLSLEARLKNDFGIDLPPFPEHEEFLPTDYFDEVTKAIDGAKEWEVLPNAMTLGFFSFAKLLMYRDLDSQNWPDANGLLGHSMITSLLSDGFQQAEHIIPSDANLDKIIPVSKLDHVVDADSSQTIAIERVRAGESAVIQGPPGTGKSQSISNIIASAVLDGKKVLFVAEKLAALQVVKRRLENEGIGALCLELHSNKANKRAVIEEIGRTWTLGRPVPLNLESLVPKLEAQREVLNRHVLALHDPHLPSSITPFVMMGQLSALGDRGGAAAGLVFPEAETWTREDFRGRRKLAEELAVRVEEIGLPSQHNWRGVGRETVLKIDLDPIESQIRSVAENLSSLVEQSSDLTSVLAQPSPISFDEVERALVVAECVANAPTVDKKALCDGVWNAGLDSLRDLLDEGRKFASAFGQVGQQVTESTWDADFSALRGEIATRGRSLLRFLYSDYRRAIRNLREALKIELPKNYSDRLSICDAVIAGQNALQHIRRGESLGLSAFGNLWRNEKSNWDQLEAVLSWVTQQQEVGLDSKFRQMFSAVQNQKQVAAMVDQLSGIADRAKIEVKELFQETRLDCLIAFDAPTLNAVPLIALTERCSIWLSDMEGLSRWNNYFVRARKARELNLGQLVDRLESGAIEPKAVSDCFDRVYYSQLLREVARQRPELAQFDGMLHSNHVVEFRHLDKERLALAKYRTLIAHYERLPPHDSGVGATGLVKAEMERKRGHRTVRRLLKDAGSVVQAIKPVFMMSPLSVAQFLEPGAVQFDLLVIDEASQVLPVDALGAIARCNQIVVVGDDKQLPPTRFFSRLTSNVDESDDNDEGEEPQAAQAQDIESILGLCSARGLSSSMLRWHYRSRHHSLIAVSNHEFYNDELYIVPSPHSASGSLGLKFNHVPEGVYDRGASRTNRVEARAVCRAILKHAREDNQKSLGVATFSIQQRQAIEDELELLRRENPDVEPFFSAHPAEPFFIKNLENVQGDERDVIFISVGYGRDASGYMAMGFGPLSVEGGERRLNVLISRAKLRCEIFSSITADDIDLERARSRGAAAFKAFLSFAQTGRLPISQPSGGEEESPFEEAVAHAVESLGYQVQRQVGIAGFFVDLGVLHPKQPGRYVLGIECDGAAYHHSRSARDRDRLRQAVLEDHGWIIHRIWSTDWFQRPSEQLRKVAEAIARAQATIDENTLGDLPSAHFEITSESENGIEREIIFEVDNRGVSRLSAPYSEASFHVPSKLDPHELYTKDMAAIVLRIVEHEGPIHEEEIVTRVRMLWGKGRAGSRIHDSVARAVRSLLTSKACVREEHCLAMLGCVARVRNRANVMSPTLRKPDHLPPTEIRAAILAILDASHGATRSEIPSAVARLLGFQATSAQLKTMIESQIGKLVRAGTLGDVNGMLKVVLLQSSAP